MPKKSVSVWLKLLDGTNKGKFCLQRRASSSKHFPYVYQATWAGKVEEGEDPEEALERECGEELGNEFCSNFDFATLNFIGEKNFTEGKNEWVSYNFFGEIGFDRLRMARIHDEAFPGFTFIGKKDLFYPVSSGKNPKENVVLFNDQYKILKRILNGPR
ncbi:MAG: NUDIX domain-containing protein [Candidatus Staskawiczbacteria bacterium]|nr:NUDIX domain-containing protein [Candidatus Staskawiczbacteria bacterium]